MRWRAVISNAVSPRYALVVEKRWRWRWKELPDSITIRPGDPRHSPTSRGALAATAAFLLWGLIPLYWKQMQSVSAFELIAHRIVWSLVFLLGVTAWRKSFAELRPAFTDTRVFFNSLLASLLLAVNWTIYVWAVNAGHVIESSLGYFLTPLCNVALGFVFLHERLRAPQWLAIAFAAAGVGLLLLRAGHVPWIALSLAGSWSNTGTIRVSGGTLNLGGTFTTAGIGTIDRTGGTVNLTGTLTNTGGTLKLNAATGSWNFTCSRTMRS